MYVGNVMCADLDFLEQIKNAPSPKQLFGAIILTSVAEALFELKKSRNMLLKSLHPDKLRSLGLDKEVTRSTLEELTKKVNAFYTEAVGKIHAGTYDVDETFSLEGKKGIYELTEHLAEGSTYNLYKAFRSGRPYCVKVLKSTDRSRLNNEIHILNHLKPKHPYDGQQQLRDVLLDKKGIVVSLVDGYDLLDVKERHPNGLPSVHIFWIVERLLTAIGKLASKKITHNSMIPDHILIIQNTHECVLAGCSGASLDGSGGVLPMDTTFCAPETLIGEKLNFRSNVYSVGKICLWLADDLDSRMRFWITTRLLCPEPYKRGDAWELCRELSELRGDVFGGQHPNVKLIV